ncbi:MAG: AI-2E family transporter [Desulfobacteraceae bacterium]|nr:MAG: AI-2E family transporter [Desulfobacteraceae bacterium]
MNQLPFSRENLFKAFFFGAFLFLIYQLLRILAAFVGPLLSAITLVMIFHPVHRYIRRKSGKRENMAAGVSTGLILFIVIVPALFFLWLVTRQAAVAYPVVQEWVMSVQTDSAPVSPSRAFSAIHKVEAVVQSFLSSWQIDSRDVFLNTVEQLSNNLSTLGTWLVKNAAFMMLNLFVMGFALFFLFRDGERIVRRVMDLVPMESIHKEHILDRLDQTLTAVVRGSFITAVTQGILAGIGFAVVGIPFSILLGFCTAFLAFIPFVGAAVAWLPASIYFFATGSLWKGVFLLVWGA